MINNTDGQDTLIAAGRVRRRPALLAGFSLCLFGILGYSMLQWTNSSVVIDKSRIQTAIVQSGDLVRDVNVLGKIVAANAPTVYSPNAGSVTLLTASGTHVEAGQKIATLESEDLISELDQEQTRLDQQKVEFSRAKLESQRAALTQKRRLDIAKVTLAAALREKQRAEVSFQKQLISDLDYRESVDEFEKAQLEFDHIQSETTLSEETLAFELKTKELEIGRQELVVASLKRKVSALSISAPVNGIVGNWLVEQKAQVALNQPLMVIVDLSAYEAEISIPESYADDLGIGLLAELNILGQIRPGKIISVSPEVKNGAVIARVRLDDTSKLNLRQNQRISARILLENKPNVLMVKRGAFINSGGNYSYTVNENHAIKTPIKIGATSVNYVEIVDGVSAGEVLVISSLESFMQREHVSLR